MMPLRDFSRPKQTPFQLERRVETLEKELRLGLNGAVQSIAQLDTALKAIDSSSNEALGKLATELKSLREAVEKCRPKADMPQPSQGTPRTTTIHPLNYSNLKRWTEMTSAPIPGSSDDEEDE